MSRLIELGRDGRAIECDMTSCWYRWAFRKNDEGKWVKERSAAQWELYEAGVRYALRARRPAKQGVSAERLKGLLDFFRSRRGRYVRVAAQMIAEVAEALDELRAQRRAAEDIAGHLGEVALEVAQILDIPLWLPMPQVMVKYAVLDDGAPGRGPRELQVYFGGQGEAWVHLDSGPGLQFLRDGKGASPNVYRALCMLAEAIRRDKESSC